MSIDRSIFRAYDIRGKYPDQINEETVYKIGRVFVGFLKTDEVIVGRDVRESAPALFESLVRGIIEAGANVIDIGQVSIGALYFASGKLDKPAIMITGSHLGKEYNGLKLCRNGAEPIGRGGELEEICKIAYKYESLEKKESVQGRVIEENILKDYIPHVLSFVDKNSLKPFNVSIDAGNGVAGKIVPLVFNDLPFKIAPLYFELDGSFPHHLPNPKELANLADLQKTVLSEKSDLGMAFDGDGDRVFFVDEKGKAIRSSLIISLLVEEILKRSPAVKIVYNVSCGRIVKETIEKNGGDPIIEKVGHSFIKAKMKECGAVFGGEASGHYYFKENFRAESGAIVALMVLEILSKKEKSFSEILKPFDKYFAIEEHNFKTEDKDGVIRRLEKNYANAVISHLDGLSVECPDWWFNIRPSNTEPLLRLNLEAKNKKILDDKFAEINWLVRKK